MRLSHSHLSVICFVKERKRIIKHFNSLSIKTFLKTSKNQTNCDILISSFNHRRSSEEPNYTPLLKNRQLPNNKKFYKNRQQSEIQQILFQILFQNFQNTFNPNPNSPKPSNLHINKHQRSSEIFFRRPLKSLQHIQIQFRLNNKSLKTFGSLIKVISPSWGK